MVKNDILKKGFAIIEENKEELTSNEYLVISNFFKNGFDIEESDSEEEYEYNEKTIGDWDYFDKYEPLNINNNTSIFRHLVSTGVICTADCKEMIPHAECREDEWFEDIVVNFCKPQIDYFKIRYLNRHIKNKNGELPEWVYDSEEFKQCKGYKKDCNESVHRYELNERTRKPNFWCSECFSEYYYKPHQKQTFFNSKPKKQSKCLISLEE